MLNNSTNEEATNNASTHTHDTEWKNPATKPKLIYGEEKWASVTFSEGTCDWEGAKGSTWELGSFFFYCSGKVLYEHVHYVKIYLEM